MQGPSIRLRPRGAGGCDRGSLGTAVARVFPFPVQSTAKGDQGDLGDRTDLHL